MRRGKIYLAFFALAVLAASPAHSNQQMALNQPPKVTINQLLPEEEAAPADLTRVKAASVQVLKSERRLDLLDHQGRTIRSYKVSLGFDPNGPKVKEGDGRTPEGRYYIDKRNEKSKFFRSLHISYPNPADVQRARSMGARTGGAIFIHGKPNNRSGLWSRRAQREDWTNGCIAVSDDEMKEIWNVVQDGTPIIIKP
jgi:murein L,D-transpeptidase YafK